MNLELPGNPRYQPKALIPYFGYDNLAKPWVEMELALLDSLHEIGVIPSEAYELLTPAVRESLFAITMTEVDALERSKTKHDVRALCLLIRDRLPKPLRGWVHIGATSFDIRDPASILVFKRSFGNVTEPSVRRLITLLADKVEQYSETVQIGRTHGQHALPITVGFWLATILDRIVLCYLGLGLAECQLRGKFSGAVGASNAQVAFGFTGTERPTFEERVLKKVGLEPAPISTQILSPEPLANFLHWHVLLSAALAQLGRDCRHLMRTEIGEIGEPFSADQTGSSTMAQKRNPVTLENTESMYLNVKNEYVKVLDTLISEHQRDLVGSSVAREFGSIVVFLQCQLDNLLREDKQTGLTFIERLTVNEEALRRNLEMTAHNFMAEPLYMALAMAGHEDAHHFINHQLVPLTHQQRDLMDVLMARAAEDDELQVIVNRIPQVIIDALNRPLSYTGRATENAKQIVAAARDVIA